MERKDATFVLTLVASLAVVGSLLTAIFGKFLTFSSPAPESNTPLLEAAGARPRVMYHPPQPEEAPENIRSAVMLGYRIITDTQHYASPHVGNTLRCASCHFSGGITQGGKNGGYSLVGIASVYPAYSPKEQRMVDLVERTNRCFQQNLNGTPLAANSKEMVALLTYYQWISTDIPIFADVPWLGVTPLLDPPPADIQQGAKIYATSCAACHSRVGQGIESTVPPVWGAQSYSSGSSLANPSTLAAFVYANMPLTAAPRLSMAQAVNVAAYIDSQPRPAMPAGDQR